MSTQSMIMTSPAGARDGQPVPIRAHGAVLRRLGHWTRSRQFGVRASSGVVLLDLRSAQIPAGDMEIHLDIDHAVVKLLVAEGAVVDSREVRRVGRCRVKDWTGTPEAGGRRIVLGGEMRRSEVRVHRGGIAILSALGQEIRAGSAAGSWRRSVSCSREYLAEACQARREGRCPTIDPSR
jgi:hypothetical protein